MARFEFYESAAEEQARLDRLADLRWQEAGNRMMLAAYRLEAVLRKANFNPDQPRVPAGNPGGGEWTGTGGGAAQRIAQPFLWVGGGRRLREPNRAPTGGRKLSW